MVTTPVASYYRITHRPYFYEVVFRDFKYSTLAAYRADVKQLYEEQLKQAPQLRTLYDVRAITVPTAYAVETFFQLSRFKFVTTDLRTAFLVKASLFTTLLQNYLLLYEGHFRIRVFTDRTAALSWLDLGFQN
jgi:hypothetical protein